MYRILYNPLSGNGTGLANAEKVKPYLDGSEPEYVDVTSIKDMKSYLSGLDTGDVIILCGGDGTLSRFINDTYGALPENIDVDRAKRAMQRAEERIAEYKRATKDSLIDIARANKALARAKARLLVKNISF